MGQTLHIVQPGNLTDNPPGSQAMLAASNVLICNPSLTTANITTLRGIAPVGALVGPSYNWQGIQQTAGAFYDSYRAKFSDDMVFPGAALFIPGTVPPNLLRAIRPEFSNGIRHADILADQLTLAATWDFLYLDDSPNVQDVGVYPTLNTRWPNNLARYFQLWTAYCEAGRDQLARRGIVTLSNCAARPIAGYAGYGVESAAGVPAALATFARTTQPGLNTAFFFAPPLEVAAVCHKGVLQLI